MSNLRVGIFPLPEIAAPAFGGLAMTIRKEE
jgi:hypothetical protein